MDKPILMFQTCTDYFPFVLGIQSIRSEKTIREAMSMLVLALEGIEMLHSGDSNCNYGWGCFRRHVLPRHSTEFH
jgi:hypothetical protein